MSVHYTDKRGVEVLRRFVSAERARVSERRPALPFTRDEYAERRSRLCTALVGAGIETLVITAPDTMCWLTGYESRWYRSGASTALPPCQCIALHAESGGSFMIETGFHRLLVSQTSCVEDLRLLPDTGLIREPTAAEFVAYLIDNLAGEGWLGDVVGLEAYSWVPSPAVWQALSQGLEAKGCRVVDATRTTRAARQSKSPAEIAYIEQAQHCCDAGIRALQRDGRPGMTGLEGWQLYIDGVVEAGGEPAAVHETVFAGPPEPLAHLFSTRDPINSGDYFFADAAAAFRHYHARCTRVLSFGQPRPEIAQLTAIAGGAFEVLTGFAAGQPFRELKSALRDYFREQDGLDQDEFFAGGYELGLSFPPDWVGEYLWGAHDPDDDALIPEGLVTNFESCAFVALVDTVVFAAGGARTLSSIPPDEVLVAGG